MDATRTWRWASGPIFFIAALSVMAIIGRVTRVNSLLFTNTAPSLAFALAWTAWWPVLKPNIPLWLHAATGLTASLLVLAGRILLARIG